MGRGLRFCCIIRVGGCEGGGVKGVKGVEGV